MISGPGKRVHKPRRVGPLTACLEHHPRRHYRFAATKDEWRLQTEILKENLLDKLRNLKESELPTEQPKIQALEEQIDALRDKQSAPEVIRIFTAIKSCLIDIRKDVYLSSKPFTLFHLPEKPTVIEIPSDDETVPLLAI